MLESIYRPYAEGLLKRIPTMNADAQKIVYGAVGKNGESIVLSASKAGKNIFNASMEAAIRCLGIFSSRSMARKVAARAFGEDQRTRKNFEEDVEPLIKNEIQRREWEADGDGVVSAVPFASGEIPSGTYTA
jgi:hypothetical protein